MEKTETFKKFWNSPETKQSRKKLFEKRKAQKSKGIPMSNMYDFDKL
ncbi:MAG: hypothetical protein V4549_03645 [Bacteroidota bacterium]